MKNTFNRVCLFFERYALQLLMALAGAVVIVFVLEYVLTFRGGISVDHTTWGEFGSILGAIAGLISFIGILLTLIQTKKMGIASEERASFFKMFEIFDDNRLRLTIPKATLEDDNFTFGRRVVDKNGIKVSGYAAFEQMAEECIHFFQESILERIPENFDENTLREICIPKKAKPIEQDFWNGIERGIQSIYIPYNAKQKKISHFSSPVASKQQMDIIAWKVIDYYYKHEVFEPLVKGLSHAANTIYSLYRNQIGIYFRNDYYLLNMIGSFLNKNNFGAIYRAQLSKDELILLFYNAFGSQATALTRKQYIMYDLFNNLSLSDVNLSNSGSINQDILRKLFNSLEATKK